MPSPERPLDRLLSRPCFSRRLDVVDSHTCGQPTRVVLSGHGLPAGMDPATARDLLRRERDWVRTVSVTEPRGHRSMFSVALIHPAEDGGEFGAVFMDAATYPDMCGHAIIGTATTLLELGLVAPPHAGFSGAFEFGLRTPSGRIALRARLEDGRCKAVSFAFDGAWYLGGFDIALPGAGAVTVDVAYAGQWYAFVPVSVTGAAIDAGHIGALVAAAAPVREALAERMAAAAPAGGTLPVVGNIVWTGLPSHPEARQRNVPISAAGAFDRSPCGTATCARMAVLVAKGGLAIGESFVNEGLLGTIYRGLPKSETSVSGQSAIVAEVEGSAWISGCGTLLIDDADPLGEGYLT
ncbi:MAG: proline racemase family protein [Rhizobiaceae bacterium]|nr:proline racemase family protein [Rhizobiaceae bacterium]